MTSPFCSRVTFFLSRACLRFVLVSLSLPSTPEAAASFRGRVSSHETVASLASSFNDRFRFIEIMLEERNEAAVTNLGKSATYRPGLLSLRAWLVDDVDVGSNIVPSIRYREFGTRLPMMRGDCVTRPRIWPAPSFRHRSKVVFQLRRILITYHTWLS